MIPPLQAVRLRSIARWQKDQARGQSVEPSATPQEIDQQMIEAFEQKEDVLRQQMMDSGTWGTWQGIASFPMERIELWNEVLADFLPTFVLDPED